ncbi:MAG: hypothetical protein QOJ07_3942 [Thermoleophilaceae bacterium]|nr:hypothetical protein [Thermoleophilaceae bacterium]
MDPEPLAATAFWGAPTSVPADVAEPIAACAFWGPPPAIDVPARAATPSVRAGSESKPLRVAIARSGPAGGAALGRPRVKLTRPAQLLGAARRVAAVYART